MADVRGLRGVRYDQARVGGVGQVIAPPYDVISPAEQAALAERHPANIIRVELPRAEPGEPPAARYERAAATLRGWLADGTLRAEAQPAVYVHDHTFSHAGQRLTRRGLFAAVRLAPWSAGAVLPHEHTLPTPKADRLSLYRATRAQISPIFALYEDGDGAIGSVLEWTATARPALDTADPGGDAHRLWVLSEPALLEELADLFAGRPLFIADGHHRYETGLAYRDERLAATPGAPDDAPYRFALMCLSDVADPGMIILPTHRLVVGPPPAAAHVEAALRQVFHVEPLPADIPTPALLARLAERQTAHAFGWVTAEGVSLLMLKDAAFLAEWMPAERSPAWRGLDVAIQQVLILERALGISAATLEERIAYTRDADEARAAVAAGQAHLALLLNPTDLTGLLAVARAGDQMPQKSTYFYPKVPTGLVLHDLA
ncbi:MAG: DUF1015 domain-containing protein [Chloroflexi bacterium]|nr:DUF1015 domain-containing protein [Chloroflexota bacterium]